MGKVVTFKIVSKVLRKNGWLEIRCKGCHHQYKHPHKGLVVTVNARVPSDTLSPGVLNNIEKTTGLSLRR